MERISRRTIDANVRAIILLLAVEERMLIMQYDVVIACDIGNAGWRDGNGTAVFVRCRNQSAVGSRQ